ncbi:MAG: hypothetical protein ACJ75H_22305 [Thermoanaerobaculia bacterium]
MSSKDALMVQVVFALAQGCGATQLSDDACEKFHDRYYKWIDKKKAHPKADGKSPQDVWATEGRAFLGHFQEIGRRAAGIGGATITAETLMASADAVEQPLECPWCSLKP